MQSQLSSAQWAQYERDGYLRLGKVLSDAELAGLQQRIDDIMLGKADVPYDRMMMQVDGLTGKVADAGPQTKGFKVPTLNYRKIQDLELDPLFLACMQKPLFRAICAKAYGEATPIACFRAMFMNKPARHGSFLAWHQDRWTDLDRDPQITIWIALDPATVANGCVQIIPGSHQALLNPEDSSGFLRADQVEEQLAKAKPVMLELAAGEAVLLHNWLLHASEVNHTDIPRRAFSICYMDAATQSQRGERFSLVFGEGALSPAAA
ncbi:MAG TPA: phytanoyl-CoA dioxygenase family protein [Caldilineaceae bacterium]|nr:phytanoyl-CoA dioxygenase family protein [Caldilineaceae bacterium]